MADIDTISVLLASVQSCLQVILLCVVGYLGAGYNIITRSTQEGLSRLIINILMPSLLFSSIGFEIDATKLIELWPVLFFYVLFFLISGSLGFFGGSALRLDKPKTKFVMTGILFNNVTSLSLGLLRGMEKTSIMEILTWNKEDTPSEAVARGTTYVLLSTFMGNLLRWSVGVYLLKNDKNDDEDLILPRSMDNNKDDSSDNITEPPLLLSSSGDAKKTNERAAPLIKNDSYDYFSGKVNNSTVVITPTTTTTSSKTSTPSESGKMVNERTPLIRNDSRDYISIINDNSNIINSSLSQKHKRSILREFIDKIGKTLNPPLGAALLGLFVGVIPPLKSLFFGHGAPFYLTITHTIEYLGSIAVPLTLISLGAQLKSLPHGKGQQMLPAIGYVMFCRFLLMPAIGITIILLTRSWYISDPMFLFVLILLACGPPAVNCINMTRLTRSFEEEMATLLFYSYIAVVPMITMLLMVILSIISSIETQS